MRHPAQREVVRMWQHRITSLVLSVTWGTSFTKSFARNWKSANSWTKIKPKKLQLFQISQYGFLMHCNTLHAMKALVSKKGKDTIVCVQWSQKWPTTDGEITLRSVPTVSYRVRKIKAVGRIIVTLGDHVTLFYVINCACSFPCAVINVSMVVLSSWKAQFSITAQFSIMKSVNKNLINNKINLIKTCIHRYISTHFDSEDEYHTGCWNVSHCQQQSYSGLHSPTRSLYSTSTYLWHDS